MRRGGRAARTRGGASWRQARTRSQKSEQIRAALLAAAADVVGEVGYAEASISLITQRAGVAQGTFYNYFESRQDILDQLLPSLGAQMQAHVAKHARAGTTFADRERRSFVAFFSYLKKSPRFLRILNEAENFAPSAYRQHFDTITRRYLAFLKRWHEAGEFPAFSEQELEVVVFVLMAARSYLALRYASLEEGENGIPDWVVRAYMKLVLYGLKASPAEAEKARSRAARGAA
jgi:AcrR family transcriptional regulator